MKSTGIAGYFWLKYCAFCAFPVIFGCLWSSCVYWNSYAVWVGSLGVGRLVLLILQLRFGLDDEMLAVLEGHWSPKVVDNEMHYGWEVSCILIPTLRTLKASPSTWRRAVHGASHTRTHMMHSDAAGLELATASPVPAPATPLISPPPPHHLRLPLM